MSRNSADLELRIKMTRDGQVINAVLKDIDVLGSKTASVGSKAVLMGNLYTKAFESIARGAGMVARQIEGMVATGFQFNRQMEDSKIAMAGLLYQYSNIEDKTKRWNTALGDSVALQQKLLKMALQTSGTYTDLVEVVRTGLAPGKQAGLTRDQIAILGQRVSQATGAMGLPSFMAVQEMRAIMTGAIDRNATVARSLGITTEDINKWKAAGTLFEELEKRFEGFGKAAAESMKTFTVLLSNISDVSQQLYGEAAREAFEEIKTVLGDILDLFAKFDENDDAIFNEDLLQIVSSVAQAFAAMAASTADLGASLLGPLALGIRMVVGLFAAIATGATKAVEVAVGGLSMLLTDVIQPFIDRMRNNLVALGDQFPTLFEKLGGEKALGVMNSLSAGANNLAVDMAKVATAAGRSSDRFAELFATQVQGYHKVQELRQKESEETGGGKNALDPEQVAKAAQKLRELYATYVKLVDQKEREAAVMQLTSDRARAILEAEHDRIEANEWLFEELGKVQELMLLDPKTAEASARMLEEAYAAKIKVIGDKLRQALIQPGLKQIAEHWGETNRPTLATVNPEVAKDTLRIAKAAADFRDAADKFEDQIFRLSDAIIAGIKGGMDGFLRSLSGGADSILGRGFDDLLGGIFGFAFGGRVGKNDQGQWGIVDSAGKWSEATADASDKVKKFGAAIDAASVAAAIYLQGREGTKKQGALSGLVTGGMAGWSIGATMGGAAGPVGAIIGAILGAAIGYFGGTDPKKYGFGVSGALNPTHGPARIHSTTNLSDDQKRAIEAQINEVRDAFWNSYVSIFLQAGRSDLLGEIGKASRSLVPGQSGAVPKAKADFFEQYEAWLSQTLPDEIAEQFKAGMAEIYTGLGMSMERFEQLWKKFDTLDPKKAVQFWQGILAAMVTMDKVWKYFERPGAGGAPASEISWPTSGRWAMDHARGTMNLGFRESIADLDQEILDVAGALNELTGEAQIQAAQTLASMMEERYQAELAYMQQLVTLSDSIAEGFDALDRSLTLEGLDDPNDQIAYLKEYLDSLFQSIATAQTPEELQSIYGEIMQTISQIMGIANQVSPEFAAEMRAWLQGADGVPGIIDILRGAFNDRIGELADVAAETGDALYEAIKPAWETFISIVEDLGGAIGGRGGPGPGGPEHPDPGVIDSFAAASTAAVDFASTLTTAAESIATSAIAITATFNATRNAIDQTMPPEEVRRRRAS